MAFLLDVKQAGTLNYDLYIYDDVQSDWYDWWTGEKKTSETSAKYYRDALAAIPANAQVNLYINSLGGSVKEGLAIYHQIKRHPAYFTGYNDGYACSIASVILTACDKAIMPRNTLVMLHFAWWWACGNPTQLRKSADDLDVINEATMQTYLMKGGDKLSKDTLLMLLEKESWLTAEECMNYGLIDEYAEYDADMSAARQRLEETQATAAARGENSPAAAHFAGFAAAALARLPSPVAKTPVAIAPPAKEQGTPPAWEAPKADTEPESLKQETEPENSAPAEAFARLLKAFVN